MSGAGNLTSKRGALLNIRNLYKRVSSVNIFKVFATSNCSSYQCKNECYRKKAKPSGEQTFVYIKVKRLFLGNCDLLCPPLCILLSCELAPGPTIPHWYRRHQTINTFYSPTTTTINFSAFRLMTQMKILRIMVIILMTKMIML